MRWFEVRKYALSVEMGKRVVQQYWYIQNGGT